MIEIVIYVSFCLLAYGLVERRLSTTPITGPIVFVALGLLASSGGLGIIEAESDDVVTVVDVVFQGTLILVLFTDAAALHFASWKQDAQLPGRLLGIGLPLTIALGALIAALLFTDLSVWEAAIIAAIIAPTDAALGQAVISNPRVPERIRQALDVESGLNDGISLPFVLIFIGLAEQSTESGAIWTFLREIGVAVGVGLAVGVAGGWLLIKAADARWMGAAWSSLQVIVIAAIAFATADGLGGSGFIATFVAGLSYGAVTRERLRKNEIVASDLGVGLVQVSFLLFGALVLETAIGAATWQMIVMALLGLTVIRVGPVALSMIGTKMSGPTLLYMGWFGPRGLATIVFAALVAESSDLAGIETIVTVAAITVGLSVLLHGLTSYPGSERYADWAASADDTAALPESKTVQHHLRRRLSRPAPGPSSVGGTDDVSSGGEW